MKRLKLLALMALLACVIAGVVCVSSPLAPVVGGPVEIEELWSIEDTREESWEPLVTALENFGVPLAYDKIENTFYCSLGLKNGEEWPELKLTAPDAPGVSICFSDDYTYDYCANAIAEGYSYELMAYTDTEYSYFYIVFTGLPVVSIRTQEEITLEEGYARFAIGSVDQGSLSCEGLVRLRGDGSLYGTEKLSYRLSFSQNRKHAMREVPFLGVVEKINLVSMAFDDTLMHDKLSWDLIEMMTKENDPFRARKTQYVEMFVNDEYQGVYLMMEPIDYEIEIGKANSTALVTDTLYRTTVVDRVRSRPVMPGERTTGYELFYSLSTKDLFEPLEDFLTMRNTNDDMQFEELALRQLDFKNVLGYSILLQITGMTDNVRNNLFIWVHYDRGKKTYRFMPWDMDRAWAADGGIGNCRWMVFPLADRLLNLNIGNSREKLQEIWVKMKTLGFTVETINQLTNDYEKELNDSGAALRNAYRWNASLADGTIIRQYASERFIFIEKLIKEIVKDEGEIEFLSDENYDRGKTYVDVKGGYLP